MYRIDNATATATLDPPTALGVEGYFTGGNPSTALAATIVDAEWLNTIQEEGANLVIGAGLTLNKADRTQWSQSVSAMITAARLIEPVGPGAFGRLETGLWEPVLALTGGDLSGGINIISAQSGMSIVSATGTASFWLDRPAGFINQIVGHTSGVVRWAINIGNTAPEGGGNTGSDFAIIRCDDLGNVIDRPFEIIRSTGNITISGQGISYPTATGGLLPHIAFGFDGTVVHAYANIVWLGSLATQQWVSANFAPLSDERVKQDIVPATVGLAEVRQIEPINYTRQPATIYGGTGTATEIGFSAQQMQSIIPEAVFETVIATSIEADDPPILGVIPQPIIAALVNAVKALDARLTAAGL